MKILFVSQSFFPSTGGVSYYLIWLAHRLREKSHDAIFINLKKPGGLSEEEIEGFKVYRVPADSEIEKEVLEGYTNFKELLLKVFHERNISLDRLYNKHIYGFNEYIKVNQYFEKRIREVIKKEEPDIVHIHDFQLLPLSKMIIDLKLPKPFTWHIPFPESIEILWRKFVVEYLREYSISIFSTKSYVSTALRSGLEWNKVSCIPPFIEVEDSNIDFRKAYNIKEDEKIILCVARIDRLKGQKFLIEAASRLRNIKFKLIFIGNGSLSKEILKVKDKEEYLRELQELISLKGLNNNVIFTGAISREMLMAAYKACDVVVLPSIQEGFGLAITEAMAFGKPVIGSCIGGISTQIWPGINGFLVSPGDVKALSECLEYILINEDIAKKMGAEGKKIFKEQFSSERGAKDHIALYKRLLGE
ncbi:MAG: glycosyltransferase family 1 protein [Candidatus Methanomethylicota archaeon]|jgi:glycosyltransferase involved in cell wall biosynthesis|uniref:Glycosyltransferase family 1 protein n=1 Tax=Thermoproteota archaeon TaxID=2056631 RepID=A0A523BAL6_9CREN|nr:MAG: glycosyltransferase family 1 protein [Candidatus Verstraetearchaeota archaeon]TDA37996.1 MAG: glycosyltransferase family 1 protein [Candidatus Verstraetearchaeota archaeon]